MIARAFRSQAGDTSSVALGVAVRGDFPAEDFAADLLGFGVGLGMGLLGEL